MQWISFDKAPNVTDWLTAIGTVGATIAAVWLGLRDNFVRLRITLMLTKSEAAESASDKPDAITVNIVNQGRRLVTLAEHAWQVGRMRSVEYPAKQDVGQSITPYDLDVGHRLRNRFTIAKQSRDFQDFITARDLRSRLTPAYFVFRSNVGKVMRQRFPRAMRRMIRGLAT